MIPTGLAAFGAHVEAPVAYRNAAPDALPAGTIEELEDRRIHCVTFTSSSTVQNLAAILGENRMLHLLEGVIIASIGPITSRSCRELGLQVHIEPQEYTLAALTAEMVRHFSAPA